MAIPRGTIRTKTDLRLADAIGALPTFSPHADDDLQFWVHPWGRGQVESRRWLVIGVPGGAVNPDGIAGGHGPSTDEWTSTCIIACTDEEDGPTARQIVESAINDVADLLARDPRLGITDGPHSTRVTSIDGPYFEWEPGKAPFAWAEFDIACATQIERNRP